LAGRLELLGQQVPLGSLAELARYGFRVVVGEKTERIVPGLSSGENATLSITSRFYRGGALRLRAMRQRAQQVLRDFRVSPADPGFRAGMLSGGNQQKLALARVIQPEPTVLILEEPFHGVDVRGRTDVKQILRSECEKGRFVLIIDSDLDEITSIATSIVVLRNGKIALVAEGQDRNKQRLLEASYGGRSVNL
jgi:ABC-type sugar transport system ATPase subunit